MPAATAGGPVGPDLQEVRRLRLGGGCRPQGTRRHRYIRQVEGPSGCIMLP